MPRMTSSKNSVHKDKFDEVCNELEQIRKELNFKKRKTLNSYTEIVTRYSQINTQTDEIKQYTTVDPFAKEKKLREQKISQYTNLLKQLEVKRDEFHTRYPDDSCDDTSKAYGAACQLVNILNGYAVSYKKQAIDLTQFKEHSSRVIQSRRNGVLSEHRGVKELLTNLLLAIGTLGIGYAIAALFTQSFTPIKCNTDTVDLLNETNKNLDEIEGVNTISI